MIGDGVREDIANGAASCLPLVPEHAARDPLPSPVFPGRGRNDLLRASLRANRADAGCQGSRLDEVALWRQRGLRHNTGVTENGPRLVAAIVDHKVDLGFEIASGGEERFCAEAWRRHGLSQDGEIGLLFEPR